MVDEVKETNHDGEKPEEETGKENKYLLPDKAYKALKWLALIALPAVAWLVGAVGPQWGLPHCGEIVTTINAIGCTCFLTCAPLSALLGEGLFLVIGLAYLCCSGLQSYVFVTIVSPAWVPVSKRRMRNPSRIVRRVRIGAGCRRAV